MDLTPGRRDAVPLPTADAPFAEKVFMNNDPAPTTGFVTYQLGADAPPERAPVAA